MNCQLLLPSPFDRENGFLFQTSSFSLMFVTFSRAVFNEQSKFMEGHLPSDRRCGRKRKLVVYKAFHKGNRPQTP